MKILSFISKEFLIYFPPYGLNAKNKKKKDNCPSVYELGAS